MNAVPDCPAPRTDGSPSRRLQSLVEHLRCDESLASVRSSMRAAAARDGNPTLSYDEYKAASLPADTRALFTELERGLTQGFNGLAWRGAVTFGVVDREIGRINTILDQQNMPRIDRDFVDEAVRRRAR